MSQAASSSIYFTSTRNVKVNDIINAFENKLRLGKIVQGNVNIVPVSKQNYNHVFFYIEWNKTEEAAKFVSELISKSSIKVYHNKGYWLCRMNRNPLKLRNKTTACIKFASTTNPDTNNFNEDDFYVI